MKIIKTLDIDNATLYDMSDGRRMRVAIFNGKVKIKEKSVYIPVLGTVSNQERKIRASFVVTDKLECSREPQLREGKLYEIVGDVFGVKTDESMIISGVHYEGIDLDTNEIVFEVTNEELIRKMLQM